jgi:UDP-glucose 4-epimerase
MKILITGGAGFIGSHLAERHLAIGDEVYILDNLSTGSMENIVHLKENPRFKYYIDSVMNEQLTAELVDLCDIIYHFAAAVGVKLIVESPVRTIETNVRGTEILLRLAAKKKKRILIASTSEVYGKQKQIPFSEDNDLVMGATNKGRWSYACSKAIDEFLAIAYWKEKRVPTVIVRLFNTVGPRQIGRYGMVVPNFVRQALKGEDITVYGDGLQTRCFTHVFDVVNALMDLVKNPNAIGEVYNVGSTQEASIMELAERVKALTGSSSRIVRVPYDKAYEKGFEDMARRVPDLTKINALTGYVPTHSLDQILTSVIDHERAKMDDRGETPIVPSTGTSLPKDEIYDKPLHSMDTMNEPSFMLNNTSWKSFDDKSILITGGTGSFGHHCVQTLLERTNARRIIVFSRDELKQSQMQSALAEHNGRLRFFIGNVRDVTRLQRAFHDVDIVIHAAALKQVPLLELNPWEAVQTNTVGTQNVINAAIDQGVKKVLLISTDKAANPANLYGATKSCAEKLIVQGNEYAAGRTLFSAVRYGNVLGSRGSLLKLIADQRKTGVVNLTHGEMTRFWITLPQGVSLVLNALERMKGREIFIPKIPSMRVKDLLTTLAPECEVRVIGIRPGEKMHELLMTPEEARHARDIGDAYAIYPEFGDGENISEKLGGTPLSDGFSYSSDRNDDWLDESRLKALIASLESSS